MSRPRDRYLKNTTTFHHRIGGVPTDTRLTSGFVQIRRGEAPPEFILEETDDIIDEMIREGRKEHSTWYGDGTMHFIEQAFAEASRPGLGTRILESFRLW